MVLLEEGILLWTIIMRHVSYAIEVEEVLCFNNIVKPKLVFIIHFPDVWLRSFRRVLAIVSDAVACKFQEQLFGCYPL